MEAPISYQILSGVYGNGTHKFKAVRQPSVYRPSTVRQPSVYRPWSVRLASAYRPSTPNQILAISIHGVVRLDHPINPNRSYSIVDDPAGALTSAVGSLGRCPSILPNSLSFCYTPYCPIIGHSHPV